MKGNLAVSQEPTQQKPGSASSATEPLPTYYRGERSKLDQLGVHGEKFAQQIIQTTQPFLSTQPDKLRVLDVGSGYGHTAAALARRCEAVVGIEPSESLYQFALENYLPAEKGNLQFHCQGTQSLTEADQFDLIVLDNVLEHIPDQPAALANISRALNPGGVLYLLVPNKLWPIEPHYALPFLSYLPLPLANRYLRLTGRGNDYTDASYSPTYFGLNRLLRGCPELSFQYVLPADLSLAAGGGSTTYRLGAAAIRRCHWLWIVSKALLVVAVKGTKD